MVRYKITCQGPGKLKNMITLIYPPWRKASVPGLLFIRIANFIALWTYYLWYLFEIYFKKNSKEQNEQVLHCSPFMHLISPTSIISISLFFWEKIFFQTQKFLENPRNTWITQVPEEVRFSRFSYTCYISGKKISATPGSWNQVP